MRFLISLAEQGFGSVLTFAVNLWLIRNGAPSAYGTYMFWLSVAWVLGTAQGTLVIAHLFRLPSAIEHAASRREPERMFLSVALILLLLAALGTLAGNAVLAASRSRLAEPDACLFIAAFLLFQYVRAFAFSRQRPLLAALLTGAILASALGLLAADLLLGHRPDASRVLLLTAAAYGGVSIIVLLVLLDGMRPMWRPSELSRHRHRLRGSVWLMLGAGSGEVTNRLYSFAVVGRYGTEALAAMSAVQVVIRPAWMLSAAWSSIALPRLAAARRSAAGPRGMARILLTGALLTVGGSLLWSTIVILGWRWVSTVLYHGRYPVLGALGVLWTANVVAGSLCVVLNTALLALGAFRPLALTDLAGACVTAIAIALVVTRAAYPFAIAATVLGQGTQIALMAALLAGRLAHRRRSVPASDAESVPGPADASTAAMLPDPALPG